MSGFSEADHAILTRMATQLSDMHDRLPDLIEAVNATTAQIREHERRIIRLETITQQPTSEDPPPPLRTVPSMTR